MSQVLLVHRQFFTQVKSIILVIMAAILDNGLVRMKQSKQLAQHGIQPVALQLTLLMFGHRLIIIPGIGLLYTVKYLI